MLDPDVAAFDVAQLAQAMAKGLDHRVMGAGSEHQHPDGGNFARLLGRRAGGHRGKCDGK